MGENGGKIRFLPGAVSLNRPGFEYLAVWHRRVAEKYKSGTLFASRLMKGNGSGGLSFITSRILFNGSNQRRRK